MWKSSASANCIWRDSVRWRHRVRHAKWHDTQRPLVDRLRGSYPLGRSDLSERQRHQHRLGLQANRSLRILQPQRDGMAVAVIKSGPPQQREKRQRRTLNSNDSHDKLYSFTCSQYHSYTIALSGSECEGSQIWKPCVCHLDVVEGRFT